ncbi:MAG: DUF1624 domain-containing protein [Alphaproteobacteria bacterium]|jgi:uncharacterized membrane protein|nr:DUF1624 domain-containing protein [Alphaproteobacteria bacterium]
MTADTAAPDTAVRTAGGRLALVDLARGIAVVLMVAYHFCWDLTFFRLVDWPLLTNPAWLAFRNLIAGLFLGLVGISLVLASRRGLRLRPFVRRLAVIAAAAAAISAATWLAIPDDFIFFGVLHHIALASVLGLAFLRLPVPLVLAAAGACLVAPAALAAPPFDEPGLRWLGLMTFAPRTNDYVPLFPWFAAVLAGIALARLALAGDGRVRDRLSRWNVPRPAAPLLWLGRRSLAVYLLHQPLLIGLLAAFLALANPAALQQSGLVPAPASGFVAECTAACTARADAAACRAYCTCMQGRLAEAGLPADAVMAPASPPERAALRDSVEACAAESGAAVRARD